MADDLARGLPIVPYFNPIHCLVFTVIRLATLKIILNFVFNFNYKPRVQSLGLPLHSFTAIIFDEL